jgi:hypothetical protein
MFDQLYGKSGNIDGTNLVPQDPYCNVVSYYTILM